MTKDLRLPSCEIWEEGTARYGFYGRVSDNELTGWGELVSEFSETHRVICLCWPGYENGGSNKLPRWGYMMSEVVAAMHETLSDIFAEEGIDKFTLVIRGLGSFLGLVYQNTFPERVARGVLRRGDCGKASVEGQSYHLAVSAVVLRGVFCLALPGKTSGKIMMIVFMLLINPFLGPTPYDKPSRPADEVTPAMLYPYWHMNMGPEGSFRKGKENMLRPRYPIGNCKILFMYGTKKMHVSRPRIP